jgi:hypothetical protein
VRYVATIEATRETPKDKAKKNRRRRMGYLRRHPAPAARLDARAERPVLPDSLYFLGCPAPCARS